MFITDANIVLISIVTTELQNASAIEAFNSWYDSVQSWGNFSVQVLNSNTQISMYKLGSCITIACDANHLFNN